MARKRLKKSVGRKVTPAAAISAPTGLISKAATAVGRKITGAKAARGVGVRGRRRLTPTKLMNSILIEKLKKKLWKTKYGGVR